MKTISTHELKEIIDANTEEAIIVDVRTRAEHKSNRIPDVLNIPLDEITQHVDNLKHYKTIYLHCHSGNRSSRACEALKSAGLEHVVNVEGGISHWENAGFPTIKSSKRTIPMMRQVLIVAGILILTGVALSSFNPNFIYLSGFVGAGLLFAGITGMCGMTKVLEKMPWNKA